jgi:death-on-curing family protein
MAKRPAIARPAGYAHYEDADLALQAAVLAYGIAEGQSFHDGNKRLALVAMLTFLELNEHRLDATDPELADWIIGLSTDLTPADLAELTTGTRDRRQLRRDRAAALDSLHPPTRAAPTPEDCESDAHEEQR